MPKIPLSNSPSRYEIETRLGWIAFDVCRLGQRIAEGYGTQNPDEIPEADKVRITVEALRSVIEEAGTTANLEELDDTDFCAAATAAIEHYESLGKGAAS